MPHDRNGHELKPGDLVTIEMTVTHVYPGAEMCNVTLTRQREGEQGLSMTCQAKQTTKLESVPTPDRWRSDSVPA